MRRLPQPFEVDAVRGILKRGAEETMGRVFAGGRKDGCVVDLRARCESGARCESEDSPLQKERKGRDGRQATMERPKTRTKRDSSLRRLTRLQEANGKGKGVGLLRSE
jgi:hypothetical protein